MDRPADIIGRVGVDVWNTIAHNWIYLLASVVVASAIQVFVGTDRLTRWLRARTWLAVVGSVALGALTPFCSCGTTAVVLGALASAVPWAPVVAFMVSSPLTSPSEYVLSSGLFGAPFASTFFVAAIVIGLTAGLLTAAIERTGALAGQARMRAPEHVALAPTSTVQSNPADTTCCGTPPSSSSVAHATTSDDGPALIGLESATSSRTSTTMTDQAPPALVNSSAAVQAPSKAREFGRALTLNSRRLASYFLAFATLGYLLIELIPTHVLTSYLGADSFWSVPVAATLGIPIYLNTDASLPLVASLMAGGMGPGAALAFLVTGAGTSVGAISGMLVIARWKIVTLIIAILWVGAVLLGYLAPLWLSQT